jgi:5-methylcytosine-specific restriction enzyme A
MAKLRTLSPLVRTLDTRTTKQPPRQIDPIYNTPEFQAWRAQVVARAGGQCQAIDDGYRCTKARPEHRMYADHIVELRDGGQPFDLNNGQCLCASHHELKTIAVRTRNGRRKPSPKALQAILTQTPLDYMLSVMNDETAAASRRDRMAIAAAQYCHRRTADTRHTKKHHAAEQAKRAGTGTEWADDLEYLDGRSRQ